MVKTASFSTSMMSKKNHSASLFYNFARILINSKNLILNGWKRVDYKSDKLLSRCCLTGLEGDCGGGVAHGQQFLKYDSNARSALRPMVHLTRRNTLRR